MDNEAAKPLIEVPGAGVYPDAVLAEQFFRLLYEGAPAGHLTLSHRRGNQIITDPADFHDLSSTAMNQVAARACKLAAQYDLYFGVGLRAEKLNGGKRGDAESVIVIPGLWNDIDLQGSAHKQTALPANEDDAITLLRRVGSGPTAIVRSGHGVHGYYLFQKPLAIDDANRIRVKTMAANLHRIIAAAAKQYGWKLDNTSDLARILRPAGTVNYKDPQNPKRVSFEKTGTHYDLLEIEGLLLEGLSDTKSRGFVGFDGFETQSKSKKDSAEGQSSDAAGLVMIDSGDFPPAYIEPILKGCAWMRHCHDAAPTLPEPDWYAMLSVLARCQDGERLAHEWSKPYSGYTRSETDKKLRHALKAAGPVTCGRVMNELGRQEFCKKCLCREYILSPISLGSVPPDNGSPTPAEGTDTEFIHPEQSAAGATVVASSVMAAATTPATTIPLGKDPTSVFTPPPSNGKPLWPEPKPLKTELPEVPAFLPELLPDSCRAYAADVSERMQVPFDFPAVALLVCLAGAVGRRAMITPKQKDSGWVVFPNLWGGIVSRPGNLKSPLISEIFRPLKALEKDAIEAHKVDMEEYEQELEKWDAAKKDALKNKQDFDEPKPQRPPALRFMANDATIEKLHELIVDNPQGILLFRDELAGWFATLDTKGRERERPFFLEGWNGDGSYTIDRIGRGTLHAEFLCISVFGGIQPGKLQNYLVDAVIGGGNDDGLVQRLQVMVWPDQNGEWHNVDRPPNIEAATTVAGVFQKIVVMSVQSPLQTRFEPQAQQLFDAWRDKLERRIRKGGLPRYMESHLAKYRSLMPSIALLLHLADGRRDTLVPLIQAQRAAQWCEYLERHALRVYSCVTGIADRAAATLADEIKNGKLGVAFTARAVYIKGWSGLTKIEQVHEALGVLQENGWVRVQPVLPNPQGGRPTEIYLVNPAVYHE